MHMCRLYEYRELIHDIGARGEWVGQWTVHEASHELIA